MEGYININYSATARLCQKMKEYIMGLEHVKLQLERLKTVMVLCEGETARSIQTACETLEEKIIKNEKLVMVVVRLLEGHSRDMLITMPAINPDTNVEVNTASLLEKLAGMGEILSTISGGGARYGMSESQLQYTLKAEELYTRVSRMYKIASDYKDIDIRYKNQAASILEEYLQTATYGIATLDISSSSTPKTSSSTSLLSTASATSTSSTVTASGTRASSTTYISSTPSTTTYISTTPSSSTTTSYISSTPSTTTHISTTPSSSKTTSYISSTPSTTTHISTTPSSSTTSSYISSTPSTTGHISATPSSSTTISYISSTPSITPSISTTISSLTNARSYVSSTTSARARSIDIGNASGISTSIRGISGTVSDRYTTIGMKYEKAYATKYATVKQLPPYEKYAYLGTSSGTVYPDGS